MIYKVSNLSFSYSKKTNVLFNVNFELTDGDILFLVGKNGSGKTTLISCLNNFNDNYVGTISIDGTDIKHQKTKQLSKTISVIPFTASEYSNLSICDFLCLGFANNLNFFKSPTQDMENMAYEVLKKFNMDKIFYKYINSISSGERQIVLICRTILQGAKVIVLDEPMANLDIKNQLLVLDVIAQLKEKGYIQIISTHNPGYPLIITSKTLLFNKGKTIFGDSSTVITTDNLKRVLDVDAEIIPSKNRRAILNFMNGNEFNLYF